MGGGGASGDEREVQRAKPGKKVPGVGKKKQSYRNRRQGRGQVIALVLVGAMAVSLVAYYFGSVGSGSTSRPTGAAGDPGAGDRYVEEGNRAYDAGDYEAAIRSYERALPWRGKDPAVLTDLGTAYFYRRPPDPAKAISYYDQALAVDSTFRNALFNKGIVLSEGQGKAAEAVEVWEKLLFVLGPADPQAARVKQLIAEARTRATSPGAVSGSGARSRLSGGFGR